jgi:hypothetical protein
MVYALTEEAIINERVYQSENGGQPDASVSGVEARRAGAAQGFSPASSALKG